MDSRIIADMKCSYGLICNRITPVTGGWLNKKWRVSTDNGEVLVKQFSNQRYSTTRLKSIESALQRQIILQKNGLPCPLIWQCGGQAIRQLDDGISYMVMEFCSGKIETSNTITTKQMHSLGSACGLMHKVFLQLPTISVNGFPIESSQTINSLWENFHACMQELSIIPTKYRNAVLLQEPILKQLTKAFFDKLPKGIAHEDFSFDNMLFDVDCMSAIIDFDRNCYSYIWHDIGRAILSFALKDNQLDLEKIHAFLEGYSQYSVLSLSDIVDALRISWCIEIPWWINPKGFKETNEKVERFKDEMLWITEHWFDLDSLILSRL